MLLISMTVLLASSHAAESIRVDGSSTVFPITEAVAEEFQTGKRGQVRVTVGVSGTGGGFKKFCRGETDLQNASRPIQAAVKPGEPGELESCRAKGVKFFELPIAYDAAVVVVNKNNKFLTEISVEELKRIWEPAAQGKIQKWNQINPSWPDKEIRLYGAGADSGTFDYFTEAIVGKAKSSRGDYTASEDDNVLVKGVAGDIHALGYLPYSYYEANKANLKAVAIVPKGKKAVLPSFETVESGIYAPLSRPLFLYVNEQSYARPAVREFVEFYLANAPKLVTEAKYVPLPLTAYKTGLEHLKTGKVGTAFGGHSEVGLKIKELMNKEKGL